MPQEIEKKAGTIDTTNSVLSIDGRKVLPQEPTKVYAAKESKHLGKHGTEHTVHAALAEKLVANGEATLKAPKIAAEVELTADELKALAVELDRKPTKADIAKAVKLKAAASAEEEQEDEL